MHLSMRAAAAEPGRGTAAVPGRLGLAAAVLTQLELAAILVLLVHFGL